MAERVLITGGAGFISSHLADELLRAGYEVRALDVLVEQVHSDSGSQRPDYLGPEVELWLESQPATDRFDRAAAELAERGLTR